MRPPLSETLMNGYLTRGSKLGMVVQTFDPSSQEVEAEDLPDLYSEYQDSQG